jgi:ATP-binding cassette, subfamily F, member 3
MIKIDKACLGFGTQTIFNEINLAIQIDQKIGLVGPNGAGKSTLLKILAGQQKFDTGKISVSGKTTIAYLPQEITLNSTKSILSETLSVFENFKTWEKVQELEQLIVLDPTNLKLAEQYAHDTAQLYEHNFEHTIAHTKKVLMGLGFKVEQFNEPTSTLSVGWRMRIVLAKLLLQEADFYLFDEPTNHLDIVAKTWFLKFLQESTSGFLLVCHDKYFLEKTCDMIIEVERGNATEYYGNYSSYLRQKKENAERLQNAYELQQKELAKKKATVERFKATASKAKMAQSMLKQIDKIELIKAPEHVRKININLKTPPTSGRVVLTIKNVAQSFEQKQIFKNVSFEIEQGQKVAIVAPNGTGKTTLFNLICKKYPLQAGTITLGHNVVTTIFEQDQNIALNHSKTIFEEIKDHSTNTTEQDIRSMLGAFLFSNNDAYKQIKVLSGGEKNRVSMVKVLLSNSNLLLLDEPTNHLDIQSKEILLDALKKYQGTILFVSHDHDFVNELASHTVFLTPLSGHLYEGSYEDYLNQEELNTQKNNKLAKTGNKAGKEKTKDLSEEQRKQASRLESQIIKLEREIEKIEAGFGDLDYGTLEFDSQLKKLDQVKNQLKSVNQEWEALT